MLLQNAAIAEHADTVVQNPIDVHADANTNPHIPPASVALHMAQMWREGARDLHDDLMNDAVAGVTGGD